MELVREDEKCTADENILICCFLLPRHLKLRVARCILRGCVVAEPPSPYSLLIPQDTFAFHFHDSRIVTSVTFSSAVYFSTLSSC